MKKNLRILLLLLSCCLLTQAKAEDVVFVFADMGFSNAQKLNDVVLGDVKLTFDKAGGATDPAYYDGDKSARVYKANTLTFASTASDKKLTKVVMTFVSGNAPKSSINYGVDLSISGTQATWEGNWSSFTITNNTTGKDQLRFTKIEVTLSGGGVQPTVPEVTSLTALKALEPGTKAWLTLGRDNPGLIEYVYDANATEAYVRDNSTAIRFYGFLPDDAGWHTNTNGALIGSVLGEYKVVDGMPEFHHVSASIADSILCLDNWQDASARPIENLGDLADDTYRADLVEVKEVGITLSGGGILTVLRVYVETYLYGVVPFEMSNSYPLEALKAQAVAARTYAMRAKSSSGSYDLSDSASSQVFRGYNASYGNAIAAVDATRGVCLMYGGSYAQCYYTASNGGQTESVASAWGG